MHSRYAQFQLQDDAIVQQLNPFRTLTILSDALAHTAVFPVNVGRLCTQAGSLR
jgi:hypothetical protein